jgi:hypothetical protein
MHSKIRRRARGSRRSVTPTTAQIQLLKYGDTAARETDADGLRILTAPRSRFRLKLANPLGVGLALVNPFVTIAEERLMVMHGDLQLLGDIERQLEV